MKSSINTSTIPSLCLVTPLNSDEEDSDMLAYSATWRELGVPGGQGKAGAPGSANTPVWTNSISSLKALPGFTPSSNPPHLTSTPNTQGQGHSKVSNMTLTSDLSVSGVSKDDSFTEGELRSGPARDADSSLNLSDYSDGCSTWPRSPASKHDETAFYSSKLNTVEKKPPRPQNLVFNSPEGLNKMIPEAKTPDGILNERTITKTNSFKGSNEGSISAKSGSSGSRGTPSLTSLHSGSGDETQSIPQNLVVRPKSRSGDKSRPVAIPEPIREHVYANVVIQDGSQVSIATTSSHYATTTLTAGSPSTVSTTTTLSTFSPKPYAVSGVAMLTKSKPARPTLPGNDETPIKDSGLIQKPVYSTPVPATAKLIITSPVAGKAEFKENPYKRSVCSPVSNEELLEIWNTATPNTEGKCYNSLPRKPNAPSGPGAAKTSVLDIDLKIGDKDPKSPEIITNNPDYTCSTLPKKRLAGALDHLHSMTPEGLSTKSSSRSQVPTSLPVTPLDNPSLSEAAPPLSPPPSQPLFPSISAMKHSFSFPVTEREMSQSQASKQPSDKNSWYGAIETSAPVTMTTTGHLSAIPTFTPREHKVSSGLNLTGFDFGMLHFQG